MKIFQIYWTSCQKSQFQNSQINSAYTKHKLNKLLWKGKSFELEVFGIASSFHFLASLTGIFLTWYPITFVHEDTSSLLPNRHLDLFSMSFLDHSAIVVWWHLLTLQQLFSSFTWAFFVRVRPQNHVKLRMLGMKRHRLAFLPCRCHRHRHLHQTNPSSLSLLFVVMCCGMKSPSRNSEDLIQQEFLLLHLHPGKFKHRMLLFQQRTQETKLHHFFSC